MQVSGVSLKCAFGGLFGSGRDTHICIAMRGPFIVAGCSNLSPRVDNDKISGGVCPHPHMFVLNLGLGFWSVGL